MPPFHFFVRFVSVGASAISFYHAEKGGATWHNFTKFEHHVDKNYMLTYNDSVGWMLENGSILLMI